MEGAAPVQICVSDLTDLFFTVLRVFGKERRIHHQRIVARDILYVHTTSFGVVYFPVKFVVTAVSAPELAFHAMLFFHDTVSVFRTLVGLPFTLEFFVADADMQPESHLGIVANH